MNKLCILFAVLTYTAVGQIDLNNFTTLQSAGKIPSDFSNTTREKVENDQQRNSTLSKKSDEEFKQSIHYSIDNMIHSGQCVYGDPISVYVDQVAQKLLKDDKELYSKLRFYTLKSNVSNAFSTHQGIIVFTTGLISQFANETQLAYVLAHEIVHFKEEHVVQTFEWKLENEYSRENITQFTNYSKEKEFEADSKAVDICLKAGYSASEIYNSFDVLMYSHLPFDEIKFPVDYFNTSLFFVPEKEFSKEVFPIKMDEAYDDKNSTHPNVAKRKETIRPFLDTKFGQGAAFVGSVEEFNKIRDYARFESVRSSIIELDLSKALYQIFLLEKEHPNNYSLTRWKVHAWMGLLFAKVNGYWSDVTITTKKLEGESAVLYQYVKKLDKNALASHALRAVTDGIKTYPESEELKKIRESILKLLTSTSDWSWTKYSEVPFSVAFAPKPQTTDSVAIATTDTLTPKPSNEPLSKYDRIKGTSGSSGKNTHLVVTSDSSKYYLFGISDLVSNSSFTSELKTYKEEFDKKEEIKNSKKKVKKKDLVPVIDKRLIVVEPTTEYYTKKKIDFDKTTVYHDKLIGAINDIAEKEDVKLYDYSSEALSQGGTDIFNQRNTMMNYLRQYAEMKEVSYFVPVDFELIQDIQQKCGTSTVLFSWTEYQTNAKRAVRTVIPGAIFPPLFPAMFMMGLSNYKMCDISFVVLDVEEGTVDYVQSNRIRSNGGNLILKSEVYNLFHAKKRKQ
jgi:hypothetical protein